MLLGEGIASNDVPCAFAILGGGCVLANEEHMEDRQRAHRHKRQKAQQGLEDVDAEGGGLGRDVQPHEDVDVLNQQ